MQSTMHPLRLRRSFACAVRGFRQTLRTEANFRIEVVAALCVAVAVVWLPLSGGERVALVLAAIAVLVAELFNTALERVMDAVHPRHSAIARDAKDAAAAAVLLTVAAAVVCAGTVAWRVILR